MNEEKLKRDLNKELCFDENMVGYKVMNNYIDKAIKIGKLEQKKEELEFLLIMKEHIETNNCPLPTLRLNDIIEQLQKEIGGNKK